MQRGRRQLLKAIGTVGAASALPVGSALAQEEPAVETVAEFVTDEAFLYGGLSSVAEALQDSGVTTPFAYAGPARGETGLGNQRTPAFEVAEDAFAETELPGRRAKIEATWNPVEAGPTNFETFLQRRNIAGAWDTIGYDVGSFYEVGQNAFTLTLVDGGEYFGPTPTQPTTSTELQTTRTDIVIGGGEEYRHFVAARRGIVNFSITTKLQAFDPERVGSEE